MADPLATFVGPCSWFGGPDDEGVDEDEGLAFLYSVDDKPAVFLATQPAGTTGLARRLNPEVYYIACRWDYDKTPKSELAGPNMAVVTAPSTGRTFLAHPTDWGPHSDTGRAADLSPGLLEALGISTDSDVSVTYPAPPRRLLPQRDPNEPKIEKEKLKKVAKVKRHRRRVTRRVERKPVKRAIARKHK